MNTANPKVVIVQSNYIPWKGYFDLINAADVFVVFDEVQYTRRDWRNRNKIKTDRGLVWLTIPVEVKGRYLQKISETVVVNGSWAEQHWSSVCHAYSKAKHFPDYKGFFEGIYEKAACLSKLSEINLLFITGICSILGIRTEILQSSQFELSNDKSERLLNICKELDASVYLSGPAAKNYLDESLFKTSGIQLEWYDYSSYPEYNQLHSPFEHFVSIIDLLFSEGPNSIKFMKSFS